MEEKIYLNKTRPSLGIYNTLFEELRTESQNYHKDLLRMTEDNFLEILCCIENDIKKQDNKFCRAITPNIKLSAIIKFLITGVSYIDLQYQFRIQQSSLSGIIPEVCDVIYQRLSPEYLRIGRKVSFVFLQIKYIS